jgi:hypothetical protein
MERKSRKKKAEIRERRKKQINETFSSPDAGSSENGGARVHLKGASTSPELRIVNATLNKYTEK